MESTLISSFQREFQHLANWFGVYTMDFMDVYI